MNRLPGGWAYISWTSYKLTYVGTKKSGDSSRICKNFSPKTLLWKLGECMMWYFCGESTLWCSYDFSSPVKSDFALGMFFFLCTWHFIVFIKDCTWSTIWCSHRIDSVSNFRHILRYSHLNFSGLSHGVMKFRILGTNYQRMCTIK